MQLVQRTLSVLSVVFFGLLGCLWMLGGLFALIAQTEGLWSIVGGIGGLAFGSLSIIAAVMTLRKKARGCIMLLVIGAINTLMWTIIGLAPFLMEFLKLRTPLPEEAETPTGPFAILAVTSILFLVFLAVMREPANRER